MNQAVTKSSIDEILFDYGARMTGDINRIQVLVDEFVHDHKLLGKAFDSKLAKHLKEFRNTAAEHWFADTSNLPSYNDLQDVPAFEREVLLLNACYGLSLKECQTIIGSQDETEVTVQFENGLKQLGKKLSLDNNDAVLAFLKKMPLIKRPRTSHFETQNLSIIMKDLRAIRQKSLWFKYLSYLLWGSVIFFLLAIAYIFFR